MDSNIKSIESIQITLDNYKEICNFCGSCPTSRGVEKSLDTEHPIITRYILEIPAKYGLTYGRMSFASTRDTIMKFPNGDLKVINQFSSIIK